MLETSVTSTDCLEVLVIKLCIAGVHKFRATKLYTVVSRLHIFIKVIVACPYIQKCVSLHAPSGKHQAKREFTGYSRTVSYHPLAPEIWRRLLDFTEICEILPCSVYCIPLTCC